MTDKEKKIIHMSFTDEQIDRINNFFDKLDKINNIEERIANIKKMLTECEYGRWKPKDGEKFFFIDAWNRVCYKNYKEINICCQEYYNTYNCFKTEEEAEAEAEKILVRRMLEDIARRLNKGEEIDWYDSEQSKYCIELYCNDIITEFYLAHKTQGTVYCLDKNFKHVAIQEIGEERLKKYLRGE